MNGSWRRVVGAFVLALTVLTLPSPAIRCACAGRMAAQMERRCGRCHQAPAPSGTRQMSCAQCCMAKVAPAAAGLTPASIQLDRFEFASAVPTAMPPSVGSPASIESASRAPPGCALRPDTPADSYLSDFLRL